MKAVAPLTPEQQLYLTTRTCRSIRRSLQAWMEFQPDTLLANAFQCSAVDVLANLLNDSDVMSDFISGYYRGHHNRLRKEQQVRYVALHWLADIACGLGR